MSHTPEFSPGQIVRFAEPVGPEDEALRYRVIEMRGARVLVESTALDAWTIRPSFVYPAADMVRA